MTRSNNEIEEKGRHNNDDEDDPDGKKPNE